MSLKAQEQARRAVHSFLDFMGDHFIKEPLPEDRELKLWAAHSIHVSMVVAINHRGTKEGEEFERAWRERLDVLLSHALKDREAYLSCIRLMELLSRDGIPIPSELGGFAARFLHGEKPPSARGERVDGAVTREGVIVACVNIANLYVDSLHGESSRTITAADIVSECLNERGILNDKGGVFTDTNVKKAYQRANGRGSAFNPRDT
ncbi:hypothetical protein [Halomonas sp. H5]|uniref:hypothetical protein n=1 Tax=Halomonas sp. H5 TaxID=3423910 RepID=UPI003D35D17C